MKCPITGDNCNCDMSIGICEEAIRISAEAMKKQIDDDILKELLEESADKH